jgi:hypothetical protein
MKIGDIEIDIFEDYKKVIIAKNVNGYESINLDEDDIYSLEFAIKEIKRKLNLK